VFEGVEEGIVDEDTEEIYCNLRSVSDLRRRRWDARLTGITKTAADNRAPAGLNSRNPTKSCVLMWTMITCSDSVGSRCQDAVKCVFIVLVHHVLISRLR
jgi:hypothetical protein